MPSPDIRSYLVDLGLSDILNHLTQMTQQVCASHDIEHVLLVTDHTRKALEHISLSPQQKLAVLLAALLHDADDQKFFPDNDNYQNARKLLDVFPDDFTEEVIYMISLVSSSQNGDTIPERALNEPWLLYPRYADRLEALGERGIQRCLQFTMTKGGALYTAKTQRAKDEEDLWNNVATLERYRAYRGKSESFIDHFYDKLLRLGNFETNNPYFQTTLRELNQPMIDLVLEFGLNGYLDLSRYH